MHHRSPTALRNRATRLADQDWQQALKVAREIKKPWFRCQAVAAVACSAPEQKVAAFAVEAADAARMSDDLFIAAAATAWPITALIKRQRPLPAIDMLNSSLELAKRIEHPVCRMDALATLYWSIFSLGSEVRAPVQRALLETARQAQSWKVGRLFKHMIGALRQDDPLAARRILAIMRPGNQRNQAARLLDEL